jgi:hypothetical protein
MADNVAITAGSGTSIATDEVSGVHYQKVKLAYGAADSATLVDGTNGLPVSVLNTSIPVTDNGGSLTVDGTVAISGTVAVTDNSGSLTVDNGGTFAVQAAQSGSWTVTVNALPAGTNLIGQVSASSETGTVYSGTTALTPKFAAISASSSGDNTVVAAVTSKKIRVLRWDLTSNGAVNAKWKSATAGDKTGLYYLTQFAGVGGSFCPVGLFETASGEALVVNLSAAVAVGGVLTYVEV